MKGIKCTPSFFASAYTFSAEIVLEYFQGKKILLPHITLYYIWYQGSKREKNVISNCAVSELMKESVSASVN